MGRSWYEDEGKYLKKKNTFYDFIDCAEHLVKNGFTTPDQLVISGRSAGKLRVPASHFSFALSLTSFSFFYEHRRFIDGSSG